MAENLQFVIRN